MECRQLHSPATKRIFSQQRRSNSVISVALTWMKVENKKKTCSLKSDDLIGFMLFTHMGLQELTHILHYYMIDAAISKLFIKKLFLPLSIDFLVIEPTNENISYFLNMLQFCHIKLYTNKSLKNGLKRIKISVVIDNFK